MWSLHNRAVRNRASAILAGANCSAASPAASDSKRDQIYPQDAPRHELMPILRLCVEPASHFENRVTTLAPRVGTSLLAPASNNFEIGQFTTSQKNASELSTN